MHARIQLDLEVPVEVGGLATFPDQLCLSDASGVVTEAWTGPQVAWKMARGSPGAFGGRDINRPALWLAGGAAAVVASVVTTLLLTRGAPDRGIVAGWDTSHLGKP